MQTLKIGVTKSVNDKRKYDRGMTCRVGPLAMFEEEKKVLNNVDNGWLS